MNPWAEYAPDAATPWTLRRVVHLHYRALWQGVVVPVHWLGCAGPVYGLSLVDRYIEALGAEPFAMRRQSFREIQETPAPQAFVELFANDVAAWKSKQEKKSCR